MTKARKAPHTRKKTTSPKQTRLLAAFHETNLALCLASGFVGPRTEPSAAPDHHLAHGGLVCSTFPVAAEDITAARGGLDYGSVALVEIRREPAMERQSLDDGGCRLPSRIPLAYVEKVYFQSDAAKKDFIARAGSYGDVPVDVVDYATDSTLFPESSLEFGRDQSRDIGQQVRDPIEPIDKVAGGIASLVHVAQHTPSLRVDELLLAAINAGQQGVMGIAAAVASLLDPVDTKLAMAAARQLEQCHPRQGFDPATFLEQVAAMPGYGSVVGRFSRHALDIVSARREVSDDAFSDADGKVGARALLLFMLNPDAEKMDAVQARVPNLGARVHALASFFVGCFLGLAAMPVSWKATSRDAFLAVGLIAFKLGSATEPELQSQVEWQPDGSGHTKILHGTRVLAERIVPPPPALRNIAQIATRLKLEPRFTEGMLSLSKPGLTDVQVKIGQSIAFPREPIVEIIATLDARGRRLSSIIAQAQNGFPGQPVLIRATKGKHKRLQGFVQVRIEALAENILAQALAALEQCNRGT